MVNSSESVLTTVASLWVGGNHGATTVSTSVATGTDTLQEITDSLIGGSAGNTIALACDVTFDAVDIIASGSGCQKSVVWIWGNSGFGNIVVDDFNVALGSSGGKSSDRDQGNECEL